MLRQSSVSPKHAGAPYPDMTYQTSRRPSHELDLCSVDLLVATLSPPPGLLVNPFPARCSAEPGSGFFLHH
jgi:hypothetical protein